MRDFLKKHRRIIAYVFWGSATTVVNFISYFLLTRLLALEPVTANILAWAISVLFAFWANRVQVFHGHGNVLWELSLFVGGRAFSGALETGLLWLCVNVWRLHDGLVKLLASMIVVVINYVVSKFIFRKKD